MTPYIIQHEDIPSESWKFTKLWKLVWAKLKISLGGKSTK